MRQGFRPVVPLADHHEVARFRCGKPTLDLWLQRHALGNQSLGSSRTFVICSDAEPRRVAGYYALSVGGVMHEHAPPAVSERMPGYPIPVVLLARLAVDVEFRPPRRSIGLGSALMMDAFSRSVRIAEEVGIRAVLVDALDEDAAAWYRYRFGFEPSPTAEHQLFLTMGQIRASLRAADLG